MSTTRRTFLAQLLAFPSAVMAGDKLDMLGVSAPSLDMLGCRGKLAVSDTPEFQIAMLTMPGCIPCASWKRVEAWKLGKRGFSFGPESSGDVFEIDQDAASKRWPKSYQFFSKYSSSHNPFRTAPGWLMLRRGEPEWITSKGVRFPANKRPGVHQASVLSSWLESRRDAEPQLSDREEVADPAGPFLVSTNGSRIFYRLRRGSVNQIWRANWGQHCYGGTWAHITRGHRLTADAVNWLLGRGASLSEVHNWIHWGKVT